MEPARGRQLTWCGRDADHGFRLLERQADTQIGKVVGDVAFFLQTFRTINVIAGPGGARVLSLNEPALRSVMESHSESAAVLLFILCRMLAARVAARMEGP